MTALYLAYISERVKRIEYYTFSRIPSSPIYLFMKMYQYLYIKEQTNKNRLDIEFSSWNELIFIQKNKLTRKKTLAILSRIHF